MPTTSERCRRVIVHGRVQGVFYRQWTCDTARALGVRGWVRNLPGGTVEALLCGDDRTLDTMVARMRTGPERARVDRIDESVLEAEVPDGFEPRYAD